MDIEEFCDTAAVYGCNSGVWLVNHDLQLAAYCSSDTYGKGDWGAVYAPTKEQYKEFLDDPDFQAMNLPKQPRELQ